MVGVVNSFEKGAYTFMILVDSYCIFMIFNAFFILFMLFKVFVKGFLYFHVTNLTVSSGELTV